MTLVCVVVFSIHNQYNNHYNKLGRRWTEADKTDSLHSKVVLHRTMKLRYFTGDIPLLGTCTIYLVSKFGLVWVHLWQHFRVSSLSLSFTQCNTHSLGSYAPFTLPWQLRPQSTNVGFSVRWRMVVRWGWNSPPCQSPSKQACAKAPCVYKQFNWIRLNVCSGLIWAKPNTPWAIKGNGWVIGTLSFSANANTSITLHHFKLYKSKSGRQRGKINTVLCGCWETWKNRTSHVTRIGPEV